MNTLKQLIIIACVTSLLAPAAWAKQHAFIWDSTNGMQDLGTLGGDSFALAINDNGQVTGTSYLADNVTSHLFLWTAENGMIDLGVPDGAIDSIGNAINAAGTIAGYSFNGSTQSIFSWSDGMFVSLPSSPDNNDQGHGINNAGYITGNRGIASGDPQAFLWNPARDLLRYLGTLGGSSSIGMAVNRGLHVTGTSAFSPSTDLHAILWTKRGGMQDIGAVTEGNILATVGASINDHDEVVGYSTIDSYAFYWSPSTPLTLLPNFQGNGTPKKGGAFQILNDGRIVGNLIRSMGVYHAALWADHNSVPQDLGTLPGGMRSYARGINRLGQVVGFSELP